MPSQNPLPCSAELQDIASQVLNLAQQKGATQAEVHLSVEEGFSVNVRNADVETLEHTREKNLSITVYIDHKTGSATTSDVSQAALVAAVEKACSIARFTGVDPYAGLADPALLAQNFSDLQLYHPWEITPAEAIALALRCEERAKSIDARITQVDGVSVSTQNYISLYANSHHFMGSSQGSEHVLSCSLIAEQNAEMERAHDYSIARSASDLESAESLAERTAAKVLARLGATQIATTQCPVIFEAPLARGLLGALVRAISGANLYRESSFLLNQRGQKIFPDYIDVYQRPHLPVGWGSAHYDSDGVATRDLDYVRGGILENYVLGDYSARRLGLQSTGNANGVHNLFVKNSSLSFNDLLKKMDKGFLVTELMGQGLNLLTGDYSRGAFGYWVENGTIQCPVHEVTIAGNLRNMFAGLVAVGSDIDRRSNIQTGSILLEEMTVAGK